MTKIEHNELICSFCKHTAHCGHSCLDESCDHCSECGCPKCLSLEFNATEIENIERGYN